MPAVTAAAPGKPIWFDIMTTDAEDARRFYGALFGWTFQVGGPETGHYAMCQLNGQQAAGLGSVPPGQSIPPAWTVYFGVRDADETVAKVTKAGGGVMMPVMDVMDFGRMAVCTDSTGAVFGLWQSKKHTGATVADEPGAMAWSEVNSRDANGAAAFYHEVFDLDARPVDDPSMQYIMLNQGETPVAGVLQMTAEWGELPPHWMTYFAVADVDKAAETVKQNGGKVVHGPFDSPYGRIAVISDPQGAVLSLLQSAPQQ